MKLLLIVILLLLNILFSCNSGRKSKDIKNAFTTENLQNDTSKWKTEQKGLDDQTKTQTPISGYRFHISGDFDGDGKKENLIEHFFSAVDNKETNKFYDSLPDYDQLVALTIRKKPYSFISSDNKSIDLLHISSNPQLLGLSYLKNEGDLNGDGTDEISYVVDWADWSNLNTWHIMTYKKDKWIELYSFPMWDWQLPDLPQPFNTYGPLGLENKIIDSKRNEVNNEMERNLKKFKGLVKKINANKIQIIFRNDEGEEDTMIVNLNRDKKKE